MANSKHGPDALNLAYMLRIAEFILGKDHIDNWNFERERPQVGNIWTNVKSLPVTHMWKKQRKVQNNS